MDNTTFYSFNVNHQIRFKPTRLGLHVMVRKAYDIYKFLPKTMKGALRSHVLNVKEKLDTDGYMKMQMWEFMNLFGSEIFNGSEMYFEIEIIIEAKHLKPIV